MEFNENTAREIITKHNLSEKTLKVWKTRGGIPDKYTDENFISSPSVTTVENQRLITVLSSDKINKTALAENCKLPTTKLRDIVRGSSSAMEDEYLAIKTRLNEVRIAAQKLIDRYGKSNYYSDQLDAMKKFLNLNREIVLVKIAPKKFIDFRNNMKVVITLEEYKQLINGLTLWCLENRL